MAIASGLGAQLGIAQEATVGTIIAPTRYLEFNSESLKLQKTIIQGMGLRSTGLYGRATRRNFTTRTASGDVSLDVASSGMGLLFKAMLGSSTSTLVSGTAYQQIHTPSALGLVGQSLTVQKGLPQTDGTVKPFTYNGCKVTGFELACTTGGILTLRLSLDAWNETTATALGTASYSATSNLFHFAQGVLTLGGTASTTAGLTSIAGGTAVASVTAATVTGTNPLKTDRFFFGSAGIKAEQIENNWRTFGGSLNAEFVNQATVYDVFATDATTALKLTFTDNRTPISGAVYSALEVLIPNVHFDGETPNADGPDIVNFAAGFTGLDDGTNPPLQIRSVTSDTSVS